MAHKPILCAGEASKYRGGNATLRRRTLGWRADSKPSGCPTAARGGRHGRTAAPTVVSEQGWSSYSARDGARSEHSLYPGPEKMLMLAVLEDAVICFHKFFAARDVRHKNIFRDAKNWLWSDRIDWPFAYRNVCDVLGIDANYLRQGLTRRQEKPPSAKTPRNRVIPPCPPPMHQRHR
jgi:hypothetical protein